MESNYVDVKVTIFRRMLLSDKADMKNIAKIIQEEGVEDPTKWLKAEDLLGDEWLYDTEEFVPVDKNDGTSTIEVFEKDKTIWENGK